MAETDRFPFTKVAAPLFAEVDQIRADRLDAEAHFIEEATFAKVVKLPDGSSGLLIAGEVIQVTPSHRAELLAKALRGPRSGLCGSVGTT